MSGTSPSLRRSRRVPRRPRWVAATNSRKLNRSTLSSPRRPARMAPSAGTGALGVSGARPTGNPKSSTTSSSTTSSRASSSASVPGSCPRGTRACSRWCPRSERARGQRVPSCRLERTWFALKRHGNGRAPVARGRRRRPISCVIRFSSPLAPTQATSGRRCASPATRRRCSSRTFSLGARRRSERHSGQVSLWTYHSPSHRAQKACAHAKFATLVRPVPGPIASRHTGHSSDASVAIATRGRRTAGVDSVGPAGHGTGRTAGVCADSAPRAGRNGAPLHTVRSWTAVPCTRFDRGRRQPAR